ncbi:MAG TPA: hypothetical protein VM490_07895 [Armatimonadaceae bacterium]|nr:hypothetical protein [Armatimonadaceae bacterium]
MNPTNTGEIASRRLARRLAAAYIRLGVIGLLGLAALVARPGETKQQVSGAKPTAAAHVRKASRPAPPLRLPALPTPPRLPGVG